MNTDILKSNLLSMFMIKNINSPSNKGNTNENEFSNILCLYLVTQFVEGIFKVIPVFYNIAIEYFNNKYMSRLKSLTKFENETEIIKGNPPKTKSASITIPININDSTNILGQAMLDYITNYKSVKHVLYDKQNFILNQNETMEIGEDVYTKMLDKFDKNLSISQTTATTTATSTTPQQIIQTLEIFSFSLTIPELRTFIEDIKEKYIIKSQNKLGEKNIILIFYRQSHLPLFLYSV